MHKDIQDYKIAVLGGDKRQRIVAESFAAIGCDVQTFAIESASRCTSYMNAEKATEEVDVILLPLPVTKDNIYLNTQGENPSPSLDEIIALAEKNRALILGGKVPELLNEQCASRGVKIIDYYKSEALQRKNALPSAEGALMLAMEHTDVTVCGMNALVCGYGRIGSLLAIMLERLGANVTVAARRDETLCEISLAGFRSVRIGTDGMNEAVRNCDVIFNTVPTVIFSEKMLTGLKNKPLYIEIASSPGGIDPSLARAVGLEIVFAPSLPGKYSPISAGKYIFETVSDILSERR